MAASSSSRPSFALPTADFSDADGLVIDRDRHRKGMPVLAAMGERKPRRVAEAAWRAVHHLRHHGERPDRACADARHQQQLGEIRPGRDSAAAAMFPFRRRAMTSSARTS